jgi:hypothetical protein
MFHRSILLLLIASLALSGGAAWAAGVFVDINSFNNQSNRDLRAYPTGVSPLSAGGGVVLQGAQNLTANPVPYYDSCYYSGGTSGVMSNLSSTLVAGSVTFNRSDGDAMNQNGDFTNSVIQNTPQVQWLTTNHGTNTTYYDNVPTGAGNAIRGIGIDSNDDICGMYTGRPGTTYGAYPYISINKGGGSFATYTPTSTYDSWATAMTTPTTSGGVASGRVAGFACPTQDQAEVWSYSISGGTMTSTVTDLEDPLSDVDPSLTCSGAIAINSSGQVVIAAAGGDGALEASITACTAGFLYNMNTQTFTSLSQGGTNLLFWDPMGAGFRMDSGHDQAINNAGQVVGYTGVQSTGTWQAAMWQPNGSGGGSIVNLNTEYAGILPAGVTLNMATAIDNDGDIAGVCTDASGNTMQAFVIYNQLPGDANGDGKVDVNDLTIVLSNFGRTGMTWSQGEFTGDGTVDVNDLTIVLAHYGQTGSASGSFSAVPEPTSLVLAGVGSICLVALAWRRLVG